MKKVLMLLSLILCLAVSLPAGAKNKKDGGQAKIKFTETTHNLGVVKEQGGPVTAKFEFINEGNGNLSISNVTVQCGCTRPKYPKKPIAPGKKGVIEVTYNPEKRLGAFDKTVTVRTNGNPRKTHLRIKGTVIPGK